MQSPDNITLRRVLRKAKVSPFKDKIDTVIDFFRTVLELERSKEPDIDSYYTYPLNFKHGDNSVMLIDLPCNQSFYKVFFNNKTLTFPKDLYIGLPILIKGKSIPYMVFGTTIDYADLKGFNPDEELLPCRISQLSLDNRHNDEFGLSDETLDSLEAEIGRAKNINDLRTIADKYFGEGTEILMELKLALSSKNIALSQISAELGKLSGNKVKSNDLLTSFLQHSEFDNLIESVSIDELIHVTPLDESQESVVAHALGNRFSVVTGAPGTGKTQVILNIIANALLKGKSVLVASKNNKAVDNVKDRFDIIDPSQYLIRFGKKEYVRSITVPAIEHVQQRLESLKRIPDNLSSLIQKYNSLIQTVKESKRKLARIEELKLQIPSLQEAVAKIRSEIESEDSRHKGAIQKIKSRFTQYEDTERLQWSTVSQMLSTFKRMRNGLQRRYSGFGRFWHNLFSKKKDAELFLDEIEVLPVEIRKYINELEVCGSVNDFGNGDEIIDQCTHVITLLDSINNFLQSISQENKNYTNKVNSLRSSLSATQQKAESAIREYGVLKENESQFRSEIKHARSQILALGPKLVEAKIMSYERQPNASHKLSSYKSYVPDNVPYKDFEVSAFTQRTKDFISVCRLIAVTSLSVKSAFPLTDGLFDLLIIDEASQCDVASAIPLILRAKQVVVIGDPMQLRHITAVKTEEENTIREHLGLTCMPYLKYVEQSLWDYSKDFISHARQNNNPITLENHYRCHHDIIGYSNLQFYGRFLGKPLVVKTDESNMSLPRRGITMIDVRGQQEGEHVNINRVEAHHCIQIAKELCSLKRDVSIGIVTPFRDQADFIKQNLPDEIKDNIEVNTAHGFQGDEKDVMIYSLVVTDNSPKSKINWIDYHVPNLVNVAVTRARQTLFVVGNADYIKRVSPERNALGFLVRYAQSKM